MQLENSAHVNVNASNAQGIPLSSYLGTGYISVDRNGRGYSHLQFLDQTGDNTNQTINAGIDVYSNGYLQIPSGNWDIAGLAENATTTDTNQNSIELLTNSYTQLGLNNGGFPSNRATPVSVLVGYGFEMTETSAGQGGGEMWVYSNSSLGFDGTNPPTRSFAAFFWYGALILNPETTFSIGMNAQFGNPNDNSGDVTFSIDMYIDNSGSDSSQLLLTNANCSLAFYADCLVRVYLESSPVVPGYTWTLINASANGTGGFRNYGFQTKLPNGVVPSPDPAPQTWQLTYET